MHFRFSPTLFFCFFLSLSWQVRAVVLITSNSSYIFAEAEAYVGASETPSDEVDLFYSAPINFREVGIPSSFGDMLVSPLVDAATTPGHATASTASSLTVDITGTPTGTVGIETPTFSVSTSAESIVFDGFGVPSTGAQSDASSVLSLAFTLDAPYQYLFSAGNLMAAGTANISAELRRQDLGSMLVVFSQSVTNSSVSPTFQGMLPAGNYVYNIDMTSSSSATNNGMSSGDASALTALTLTPMTVVPVPAAVWLFGSGLLGLVGVARRSLTRSVRIG